jgi:glycosyltransferase involved in cell wall biosynthesis
MVDESVGALFEVGSPVSLANEVNNLLANYEKRAIFAEAGRKRVVSEYTYDLNATKYANFYAE